jgi:hypothetical protein
VGSPAGRQFAKDMAITMHRSWLHRSWLHRGLLLVLLAPLLVVLGAVSTITTAGASAICWAGPAVVRGNLWLLGNQYANQAASRSFSFGRAGDHPFFGHWDAHAVNSAPGVVRGRTWYLRNTQTTGPANLTFVYGQLGDIPLMGDWNGDGTDTPGVVRGHTWDLRTSNSGGPADITFTFNAPGIPVYTPWVGEAPHPTTFDAGTWYQRNTETSGPADSTYSFGRVGDLPVGVGFFVQNPDCVSPSTTVVRGNSWLINQGANGYSFSFGRPGDTFLSQHY